MSTRSRRPGRAEVHRRLLAAALPVFSERGYDRTSLEEVAAAAGFSKGAVYSNFAGKDELFLALMDQQVQARVDAARDALAVPHDRADAARLVGARLTAAFTEDRDWQLLFLEYVARAVRDPAVRARFAAHRGHLRRLIAGTVRDLVGAGPPGLDPDAMAVTILALSNGLAIERLADPAAVPDDLLGRILRGLLPGQAGEV